VQDVNGAGSLAFCDFYRKNIFFDQKNHIFLGEKAFFFKTEIKTSTFQDAGLNQNGAPDMSYHELDRFIGSLIYSTWRFIFFMLWLK